MQNMFSNEKNVNLRLELNCVYLRNTDYFQSMIGLAFYKHFIETTRTQYFFLEEV